MKRLRLVRFAMMRFANRTASIAGNRSVHNGLRTGR
jgi:hypothetical protein